MSVFTVQCQTKLTCFFSFSCIVIDRNISFGASGIFYQEVKAAMYNEADCPPIFGIVTGIGGRDVASTDIIDIVDRTDGLSGPREDIIFEGVRLQ